MIKIESYKRRKKGGYRKVVVVNGYTRRPKPTKEKVYIETNDTEAEDENLQD